MYQNFIIPYSQEPHLSLPGPDQSCNSPHSSSLYWFSRFIINHFMWSLLMALEPKLWSKYIILYSLLRFVIQFLQYCVRYSFICYGWQAAHLKALSSLDSITCTYAGREWDSNVCCQSHRTVFGYTNRLFNRLQSISFGITGLVKCLRLVTAQSALIFFTCKTDKYRLMKLISPWMYFEPRYYRDEVMEYKFLSIPFRAFLLIPPQIYQLNSNMFIYLLHSSAVFRCSIHQKYG
jgi:hypothetical protein